MVEINKEFSTTEIFYVIPVKEKKHNHTIISGCSYKLVHSLGEMSRNEVNTEVRVGSKIRVLRRIDFMWFPVGPTVLYVCELSNGIQFYAYVFVGDPSGYIHWNPPWDMEVDRKYRGKL